jgi:hypothetical protein
MFLRKARILPTIEGSTNLEYFSPFVRNGIVSKNVGANFLQSFLSRLLPDSATNIRLD